MITKKAKVNLISFTPNPIELMCWARRVMHAPVPDSLEELWQDPVKWLGMPIDQYVSEVLMKDGMPTFLEYVNLTFKLENVSRALQQQLTRHRIGFSYSIQSMRCVELPKFAENGDYYNPFNEEDALDEEGENLNEMYHRRMKAIQDEYNISLGQGVNTQDARGLLPMNIYSTITFSCSLRAFIGMCNKRLCQKTQPEFREVAKLMMQEISSKMDPRILQWIGPPCKFGRCMMSGENEQQIKENKFRGKQNTDHCCPVYLEKFRKDVLPALIG